MILTYKHLEQIENIASLKSFAKASKKLHISQPALSRSISNLEAQLGVQLFDRRHNDVAPTSYGRYIVEKGGSLILGLKMLERDLGLLKENPAGGIQIGCSPIVAELFMGEALSRFNELYPLVDLHVTVGCTQDLLPKLRERSIDLMISDMRMLSREKDLEIIDMKQRQAYFCCNKDHPLLIDKSVGIKEILKYPFVVMELPKKVVEQMSKLTGEQLNDVTDLPTGVIKCDNFNILHSIISSTNAIGISIDGLIETSHFKHNLRLITSVKLDEFITSYGVITLKGYSQPPAIEVFSKCIVEAADMSSV